MSNRYPGICYKCGNHCAPGEGVFEKVNRDARRKWPLMPYSIRWQVQHHECVRDYPREAHHKYNPISPPTDARYQLAIAASLSQ